MLPKIAIIGRPNVGKSTLFNRLIAKVNNRIGSAIVDDSFGVTRDVKVIPTQWRDICFELADAAGIEGKPSKQEVQAQMQSMARDLIKRADIVLYIYDNSIGLIAEDLECARIARNLIKKDAIVVAISNKCDLANNGDNEGLRLGFTHHIEFSALHGRGMDELYNIMEPHCPKIILDRPDTQSIIKMALVGRPNVGKSTLLNAILGKQRVITSDIAGTTRDSIEEEFEYREQKFCLIDTAGIRRRSRIDDGVEYYSALRSHMEIEYANICLLLIDATQGLERQDINIANYIIDEGRVPLLVLNKWDLITPAARISLLKSIEQDLQDNLAQLKKPIVCPISALNQDNIQQILIDSIRLYKKWRYRITTGRLNTWIEKAQAKYAPPGSKGVGLIKYATQAKENPPTIICFCSRKKVPENYQRYLYNNFCESFDLYGVPIRFKFRYKDLK